MTPAAESADRAPAGGERICNPGHAVPVTAAADQEAEDAGAGVLAPANEVVETTNSVASAATKVAMPRFLLMVASFPTPLCQQPRRKATIHQREYLRFSSVSGSRAGVNRNLCDHHATRRRRS